MHVKCVVGELQGMRSDDTALGIKNINICSAILSKEANKERTFGRETK